MVSPSLPAKASTHTSFTASFVVGLPICRGTDKLHSLGQSCHIGWVWLVGDLVKLDSKGIRNTPADVDDFVLVSVACCIDFYHLDLVHLLDYIVELG